PPKPHAEKPQPTKAEPPKPAAPVPTKPSAPAPARPAATAAARGAETREPQDAYAAAAQRFQSQHGNGGLGGSDTGAGPIGSGGGQLVGLEFLAYKQRVENAVKGNWINAAVTPGLVAKVRFEIAADGAVSGVRMEQSSGNAAYDASVQRAVLHSNPLPPPPGK